MAERLEAERSRRTVECNSIVAEIDDLILAWPQTYMNRSGYAARCLVERHGLALGDALVVYDEVALPLGRLRLRGRGGPGGHRGMESVIANLKSEKVARLRLGIGAPDGAQPDDDLSEYVLEPFRADERETADEMIERAADACLAWWRHGVEPAMNEFNRE